jgi:hypothetical protein
MDQSDLTSLSHTEFVNYCYTFFCGTCKYVYSKYNLSICPLCGKFAHYHSPTREPFKELILKPLLFDLELELLYKIALELNWPHAILLDKLQALKARLEPKPFSRFNL